MAAPAAVIVVMVVIMAVVGVAWTILYLLARVRAMRDGITRARDDVQPAIARLQADAELARSELRRVQEAADDLRH